MVTTKTILLTLLLLLAPPLLEPAAVQSGSTTCPSSGNKRVSSISLPAATVTIQSANGNMGAIHLGGSTVDTSTGIRLDSPGDTQTFPPLGNSNSYNLSQIYFACSNADDSITWNFN